MENSKKTNSIDAAEILERYAVATAQKAQWESIWQDCYNYALPYSGGSSKSYDHLYDGTAADAVDQLAASMLANLTPPWSRWIGIVPGPDLSEEERSRTTAVFEKIATTVQAHVDRSNFTIEAHQTFLDLVTAGTACLLFEETQPGERSAFRFSAIPLREVVLEEGVSGRLDTTYRKSVMTAKQIRYRFRGAEIPAQLQKDDNVEAEVLEAVMPNSNGYTYTAILLDGSGSSYVLKEVSLSYSPYINFRWMKAAGEVYGRSPVMKALPDIRTANKVVELVLRNASIATTGIWQADDDGVLNPANIRLVPGAIIPKAQGSAGLTPLAAPGRFDVSQLVLDDLRARIRHALLVDRLGQVNAPRMTATEVLERSAEMARILGATYGRLQSELLTPLILRAASILRKRGEIPDISLDGRLVDLQHRSPLAQDQAQRDIQATLQWLTSAAGLGPVGAAAIDAQAAVRWLGRALGVPADLVRPEVVPVQNSNVSLSNSPTNQGEKNG